MAMVFQWLDARSRANYYDGMDKFEANDQIIKPLHKGYIYVTAYAINS